MEILKINNLTFKYPENDREILKDISLDIKSGEFVTICGKSGCGKTTLLRHLKPSLTPHGISRGTIEFNGCEIGKINEREQCKKIGYVQQRPDNQIVTDKVWHELAFGLENLGYKTEEIRTKVAEMASFFGIQNWFLKDVTDLSGGQKQLLNLASVMIMQPDVLILDEPTAQLDPITAVNLLETVSKINRELGTTVILTEHRLEEVFPMSDRIVVIEDGKIIADDIPKNIGKKLIGNPIFNALPTPVRVYYSVENGCECPVTIREGRKWLEAIRKTDELKTITPEKINDVLIELKDVWFKYEKDAPDIIKGLSTKIYAGEIFAIVGGNGTGKTTAMSVICGLLKPYSGNVLVAGKNISKISDKFRGLFGVLPQDPQSVFSQNTVYGELAEMSDNEEKVNKIAKQCHIDHLLKSHPYDLSGGEQQRLALAKILLLEPKILLMDEPTKGFDSYFKEKFANILSDLKAKGITIVMVSHDIEFCAKYADRCAMFFDGNITSVDNSREFFAGKNFYTTAANRMARSFIPNAVLAEDIIESINGKKDIL